MKPPRNPYETFARFYDAAMGTRARDTLLLQQLLASHHPSARTVLELACGTGSLLKHLTPRYHVAGLDTSAAMLARAKKKLPRVPFHRQDMTRFRLPARFDAVFCVFNSLNHVLPFAGWERTFASVARHLNPLGVFIFEINTLKRLETDIDEPALIHPFGPHYIWMKTTDERGGRSTLRVKVFEHQTRDRYRLTEIRIREASFPPARIKRALRPWFATVHVLDPQRARPSDQSERLYFICHKKASIRT